MTDTRFDRRTGASQPTNSRWDGSGTTAPRPVPLEERNIPELFLERALERSQKVFARWRDRADNQWMVMYWREALHDVAAVAAYLKKIGVQKGDRVAILSASRYEWLIADFAILSAGAVSTPIFHSASPEQTAFIIWETEPKAVFVENEEQLRKISLLKERAIEIPATEHHAGGPVNIPVPQAVLFEPCAETTIPFSSWDKIREHHEDAVSLMRHFSEAIQPQDVAAIIYTSGSTGAPKGAVLTHRNILSLLDSVVRSGLIGAGERTFLSLPLAHSFPRITAYSAVAAGGDVIFPTAVDPRVSKFDSARILSDLANSHPVVFPAVPRFFEKLLYNIRNGKGPRPALARWALKARASAAPLKRKAGAMLCSWIRRKIFGRNLHYAISGGARLEREVAKVFEELGVLVLEGYGLSEASPAVTANTPFSSRPGSVGKPFDCVKLKIASDGEILVSGPTVFRGYWRRPQATAEALAGGWLYTGDVGEIDEDGFLWLTGRKKEIIILSNGKKIAPAAIETKAAFCSLISNLLLYGEGKPYVTALVTLKEDEVRRWAASQSLPYPLAADDPKLLKAIWAELESLQAALSPHERAKKLLVIPEEFSAANGLLSAMYKPRKPIIFERYRLEIERLYS